MFVEGHGCSIELSDDRVVLRAKGAMGKAALGTDERVIPLVSVQAAHFKPASLLTNGRLEITTPRGLTQVHFLKKSQAGMQELHQALLAATQASAEQTNARLHSDVGERLEEAVEHQQERLEQLQADQAQRREEYRQQQDRISAEYRERDQANRARWAEQQDASRAKLQQIRDDHHERRQQIADDYQQRQQEIANTYEQRRGQIRADHEQASQELSQQWSDWRASRQERKSHKAWEKAMGEVAEAERLRDFIANFQPLDAAAAMREGAMLAPGESLYYKIDHASCVEVRRQRGHTVGQSSGMSFRIAKGVSYRVGVSKGRYVPGPEAPTEIDRGTALITSKRVVFTGPRATREWAFAKLAGVDADPNDAWIALPVTNRQKTSGIGYGRDVAGPVFLALQLALADHQGSRQHLLATVEAELAELRAAVPAL